MQPAVISVVVATYNRPDVLAHTLRAVQMQTEQRWQLLLIGDHCDERTQALVDELAEPRIRYINLPRRCGEQAGPNSVGMLLADTDFIALLNHDDLWLPDHLERALDSLQRSEADLYVARAAFAFASKDAGNRPYFGETSPLERPLHRVYNANPSLFEPCSSWVMRRELARRVGGWRSGRQLYRTTLQDWMMRAWRQGARLCSDPLISVIKFNTHHPGRRQPEQPAYDWGDREQAATLEMLRASGATALRSQIDLDLNSPARMKLRKRDPFRLLNQHPSRAAALASRLLLSSAAAWIYRTTGLDGFNLYARLWGKPRGSLLESLSQIRIGKPMPPPYDLPELLAHARQKMKNHV